MWVYSAGAQDRFHSKASQLWPQGAFPEGSSESVEQRRYRLGVRTPDSQSGNPGSIPGTATSTLFDFHTSADKAQEEGIATRGQRDSWADTCSRLGRARRKQVRSTGAEAVLRFAEGGSGALVDFSGATSSLCVAIFHTYPKGSASLPYRSPPNWSGTR